MWTGLGSKTLRRLELDHVERTKLFILLFRRTKQTFAVFIWLVSFYACFELRGEVTILRVCRECVLCDQRSGPPITVTEHSNVLFFGRITGRNSRSLTVTEFSYHRRKTKGAFDQSQQTQITQLINQDSRKATCFKRGKSA